MELAEGGEAEKDVDDVGRQIDADSPLFSKNARKGPQQGLVVGQLLQVVRISKQSMPL